MNILRKKYFLNLILFIFPSCATPSSEQLSLRPNPIFNTFITIHYQKEEDKKFTPFQQYENFALEDYGIEKPPEHAIENENLKITIKLNLSKPSLLLFGFNEFYIQPDNKVDINYIVLKQSKTEFSDSIHINTGNAIVTRMGGNVPFLDTKYINNITANTSKTQVNKEINLETLLEASINSVNQIYLKDPDLKRSDSIRDFLQQYYMQSYFVELIVRLKKVLPIMRGDLQSHTRALVKELSESLSKALTIKARPYYFGISKVYESVHRYDFEGTFYTYEKIKPIIQNYDPITQQFLLLLAIKNSTTFSENSKNSDSLRINLSHLGDYIFYPAFKKYAEKFKSGSSQGYINSDIRNCILYDFNLKQINFNTIINTSSQEYILFDFCGSWCKPCLEEIKEYAVDKKLDTSTIVKPIWIFFENNKTDWFTVIQKYNLKKENCFLLEDKEIITKSFGELFSWKGEFPHHFLFNNKGRIIEKNVESLTFFDPGYLLKNKVKSNPELQPPPKK